MGASAYQVLKARFSINGLIYYSYTKLCFEKNMQNFIVPIILVPIMLISNSLNLYNAHINEENDDILLFSFILFAFGILAVISWIKYKKYKHLDGQEYTFREIKALRIKESKHRANLKFEFTDGTKHRITIKKGDAFTDLFKRLSFANVPISKK